MGKLGQIRGTWGVGGADQQSTKPMALSSSQWEE